MLFLSRALVILVWPTLQLAWIMRPLEDSPFDHCCRSNTRRYYTVHVTESIQLLPRVVGVITTFVMLVARNLLITPLLLTLNVIITVFSKLAQIATICVAFVASVVTDCQSIAANCTSQQYH